MGRGIGGVGEAESGPFLYHKIGFATDLGRKRIILSGNLGLKEEMAVLSDKFEPVSVFRGGAGLRQRLTRAIQEVRRLKAGSCDNVIQFDGHLARGVHGAIL